MKIAKLLTESKVKPPDKRDMLYFQTQALEYDCGPKFEVDAVLTSEDANPTLKICFPEHYEFEITVTFKDSSIEAIVNSFGIDGGGKCKYIMRQFPNSITVLVDGGLLSDGSNSKHCASWKAAIDIFMKDVDAMIKDMWATPGSANG